MQSFACPEYGQGVEAYEGKVTMRDAHGKIKTILCVRWRDGDCNGCEREVDPAEASGQSPRELHERK